MLMSIALLGEKLVNDFDDQRKVFALSRVFANVEQPVEAGLVELGKRGVVFINTCGQELVQPQVDFLPVSFLLLLGYAALLPPADNVGDELNTLSLGDYLLGEENPVGH